MKPIADTGGGRPLSHQVAAAGSLAVLGKFAARLIDLALLAALSRLLTPADFGLVALAMTAVLISESITQTPFGQITLGVADPQASHFDTTFTLSALRGAVLAALLAVAAWGMARVYHDARLQPLVTTLSLAPILRGLYNPRMIIFARVMDFRRDVALELAGKAVAFLVSGALALATRSYWAIAAATIATPLTSTALSYVLAPYRPRFSLAHWRLYRGFLSWNTLAQLARALSWQADRLILGRFLPRAQLGGYAMASDLSGVALQAVATPLEGPVYAAYAAHRRAGADLAEAHLKAANATLALVGPALVGLSMLAAPLVALLLGPKWTETAALLGWLPLAYLANLPVFHLGGLAIILDRQRIHAERVLIEAALLLPAMAAGAMIAGVWGVVAARLGASVVMLIVGFALVRRLIGVSVVRQFAALRRSLAALLVLAAALGGLSPAISYAGTPALAASTFGVGLVGAGAYVATLFALWVAEGRPPGVERLAAERLAARLRRRERRAA